MRTQPSQEELNKPKSIWFSSNIFNDLMRYSTQVQSLGQKLFWRREWQPTPVFLPGKFHGQRSLVGYSPWSHKRSDTTERLTLSLSLVRNVELRSYHQPEEFRKGQKERGGSSPYVLPMSQNPLRWNPSWLSEAQLTRKDPESE